MATTEERMRVLKMVEEGKITPEDAAKLLSALTDSARVKPGPTASGSARPESGRAAGGQRAKNIRIRINDSSRGGSKNINVVLPVGVVGFLARLANRMGFDPAKSPGSEAVDVHELWSVIQSGTTGKIIDINGDDGERVEVVLE